VEHDARPVQGHYGNHARFVFHVPPRQRTPLTREVLAAFHIDAMKVASRITRLPAHHMHMRGQMYDCIASRDRCAPIRIRTDVPDSKRRNLRPIRRRPGRATDQISLQTQGSAQCPADEALCACDQNGGQNAALAKTKCRDGLLDAVGSLWQTGLMLREVICNRNLRITPF